MTTQPTMSDSLAAPSDFEREKWRAELDIRARELALKEREQKNKDDELELKRRELTRSKWGSPLIVAIFVAAFAAMGNIVVTLLNGMDQRGLEDKKRGGELALEQSKAESTRILEMIKTGDPEAAAKNLAFLLDTGLVTEPSTATKLRDYLANRQPGSGPQLPAPTRFGFEQSDSLTPALQNKLQSDLENYIGYLNGIGFPRDLAKTRIKVEKLKDAISYYDPTENVVVIDIRLSSDSSVALRDYGHHVLLETGKNVKPLAQSRNQFYAIESAVSDYFVCSFLRNPRFGEVAAKVRNTGRPVTHLLDNTRSFTEFASLHDDYEFWEVGTEIWGGPLWEIRTRISPTVFDPILVKAWTAIDWPRESPRMPLAFVEGLLAAAGDRVDRAQLDGIRDVFAKRGFPVPK